MDAIRTLLDDDLGDKVSGDGQEIDLVRERVGGLNRGDVGIHQDSGHAFFLQGFNGLAAGVVKLTGLTDL